jgi:hypothetical protein
MIGSLEQAKTKAGDEVLIAAFLNGTPVPYAICYLPNGLVKRIPISDLSVHWHRNPEISENNGWKNDFEDE